jgi:hypothetical protein
MNRSNSSRGRVAAWLVVLLFLPVCSYAASMGDLRISFMEGDVQIKTPDVDDWVPAAINTPLMEGDILWVPDESRSGIQLRDGSYIRLNENTSFEIVRLGDNDHSYQFYLNAGEAYISFRAWKGSFLQIDTPASSLRTYDPTTCNIRVVENGPTRVSVYKGRVDAEIESGQATVNPGNILSLGGEADTEFSFVGPPDPWERWNMDRDRRLNMRASERYLPEELRPYSSDFDENGRWVNVPEYGYVWTPKVMVSAGWAPYRTGRWVYMRGDYVWVSYEPWGWAPYHYGRWAYLASVGWFWVPPARGAVYWGPGYVGWVYTPTYVSWVPLAPREIYYGHGYYGPHSVNVTTVNVRTVNVTKVVYRNVRVNNSVTVIHHDTFVRGRPVEVHVRENPFLREKISIGRPDIKPERATFMPVVKDIPDRRRPPEVVRDLRVREVKEKRPLVREKQMSVFNPHLPPKELQIRHRDVQPGEERLIERTRPVEAEKTRPSPPKDFKPQKPDEFKPQKQADTARPPEKRDLKQEKGRSVEKSREPVPFEKKFEPPKDVKPERSERKPEKSKEIKPPEGNGNKAREQSKREKGFESVQEPGPAEKGLERRNVERKPSESDLKREKPRDSRADQGPAEKIQETGHDKAATHDAREKAEKGRNGKQAEPRGDAREKGEKRAD